MSAEHSTHEDPRTPAVGTTRRRSVPAWVWHIVPVVAVAIVASLVPISTGAKPAAAAPPLSNFCNESPLTNAEGKYINRPQTIIQQAENPKMMCEYEQWVLQQWTEMRGYEWDAEEQARLLSWGRSDARAAIFTDLLRVVNTLQADRTPHETVAYEWLQERVREMRIRMALRSVDEYQKWEVDPCQFNPPEGFEYHAGCKKPTVGSNNMIEVFTGPPSPPAYEEFVAYGARKTLEDLYAGINPDVIGNTSRALTVGAILAASTIGISAAAVATVLALGSVIAVKAALFPFATFGIALALGVVLLPIAIVAIFIIMAIVRGVQVFEDAEIPMHLNDNLFEAFQTPHLPHFVTENADMAVVFAAFLGATNPDYPDGIGKPTPPEHPSEYAPSFLVTGGNLPQRWTQEIIVEDEAGKVVRAFIDDGWWVIHPLDGSAPRMQRELLYEDRSGHTHSAALVNGEFLVMNIENQTSKAGCPASVCAQTDRIRPYTWNLDNETRYVSEVVLSSPRLMMIEGPIVQGSTTQGEEGILHAEAVNTLGTPVTYRWRISRESVTQPGKIVEDFVEGQTVPYRWNAGGLHTIEVTATDTFGSTLTVETYEEIEHIPGELEIRQQLVRSIEDLPDMWQPWREGNGQGLLIVSSNIEGPTTFSVDWEDDGFWDAVVESPNHTAQFSQPVYEDQGIYPARIMAQTDDGQAMVEVFGVEVLNEPPNYAEVQVLVDGEWVSQLHVTPPALYFEEGDHVTVRARVTDPGIHDTLDMHMNFGNQHTEVFRDVPHGEWWSFTYQYRNWEGTGVSVDVYDDDGGVRPSHFSVGGYVDFVVTEKLPEVHNVEVTVDEDGFATLSANYSDVFDDANRFVVDWGDGSEPIETKLPMLIPPPAHLPGGFSWLSWDTLTASHQYATSGTYTVTLSVYDDVPVGTHVQTPVDVDIRPSFDEITDLDLAPERKAKIVLKASDVDDATEALTVEIDWGDETTSNAVYDPETDEFVGEHTYDDDGTYDVTITVTDSDGTSSEPFVGTLEVTDIEPGALSATADEIDFGAVEVGTSSDTETITITNDGEYRVTMGSISIVGEDSDQFVIESEDCTDVVLEADESCDVEVGFAPDTEGVTSVSLVVPNDTDSFAVELSGRGAVVQAPSLTPPDVDFGDVVTDERTTRDVKVRNNGYLAVRVSSVGITDPSGSDDEEEGDGVVSALGVGTLSWDGFSIDDEDCTDVELAPDEECTVTIAFEPTGLGEHAALFTVDGDVATSAELSGTGVEPPQTGGPGDPAAPGGPGGPGAPGDPGGTGDNPNGSGTGDASGERTGSDPAATGQLAFTGLGMLLLLALGLLAVALGSAARTAGTARRRA